MGNWFEENQLKNATGTTRTRTFEHQKKTHGQLFPDKEDPRNDLAPRTENNTIDRILGKRIDERYRPANQGYKN